MDLFQGFLSALQPLAVVMAFAGTGVGIIFGAIPGLTSTMAVGLLIPVTFGFPPAIGLVFLVGIYCGSMYGGSISAILLNTPGTPSSAATAIEGYLMTRKGEGGKALAVATVASFTGGMVSTLSLILIAPQLAKIALLFGPAEYFAVACFGMTMISSLSSNALVKGCIAGLIGMFIGTVGMDPITGYARFTFGQLALLEGISIIPALIGLFSVTQVLHLLEHLQRGESFAVKSPIKTGKVWLSWQEFRKLFGIMLRGSGIGTLIGIIPAAGGDIAAFLGYNEARRFSRSKELFGKGSMEGVAGAESANNGVTGGSLIPLLTLGIPGNSVTAVFLGGLLIQGLRPGPSLFTTQAEITYTFFAGMVIANFAILVLGFWGSRLFIKVLNIPTSLLLPLILSFCAIGSFAIRSSLFDVWLMLGFGILGFFLRKTGFSIAPVVLGIILGPLAEGNFRRFMQASQGEFLPMLEKPIVLVLFAMSLVSLVGPVIVRYMKRERKQTSQAR